MLHVPHGQPGGAGLARALFFLSLLIFKGFLGLLTKRKKTVR
jgi:hypothetical protein